MTRNEHKKYEKSILFFFIKGTLSDLSKALIFFLFFYFFGLHKEYLWGLFFLISFRTYSGGIHCKTYINCLLLSLVILSSGILLSINYFFSKITSIIISVICEIIIILLTPIQATTRPPLSPKQKQKAKVQESVIIVAFIFIILFFKTNSVTNIGVWMLILHTIQLIVAKIRR